MPSFISICATATLTALVAAVPASQVERAATPLLPFWGKGNLEVYRNDEKIGCLGPNGYLVRKDKRCGTYYGDWQPDGFWQTSTDLHPHQGCQFSYGTNDFPNRFACVEAWPSADFTTDGDYLVNPGSNTTSFFLYDNGAFAVRILDDSYDEPPTKEVQIVWKSLNGTTS